MQHPLALVPQDTAYINDESIDIH